MAGKQLYKVTTPTGIETQMRFTPEEAKRYEQRNPGTKVSSTSTPTAVQARNKGRTTATNKARKTTARKTTTARKKSTAKKTSRKTTRRRGSR